MSVFINGWTKEKVIEHIKGNFKGKSFNPDRNLHECLYRGPNGRKCAVGMFIPDDKYSERMEGKSAWDLMRNKQGHEEFTKLMPLTAMEMDNLQSEHDNSATDEECLIRMIKYVEDL